MHYVESIGGEDVVFPVLTVAQYEQVEQLARLGKRAEFAKYADESKLTGTDRFKALCEVRPDHVDPNVVASYIETLDGTRKVLSLSLIASGKSAEQAAAAVERLDFLDALNLAKSLVRFSKRLRPGMKSAEEAQDPLP